MTVSWNICTQNPPHLNFPWNLLDWFSAQHGAWKHFLGAQGRINSVDRGTLLTDFPLRLEEGGSALSREPLPVQRLVTRRWSRVVSAHVARGEYRGEISPWQLSGCITGEFTVSVATHSSVAWRIQWTEEPGRLQSMGSQRVGHDLITNTFTFTYSLRANLVGRRWYYLFVFSV